MSNPNTKDLSNSIEVNNPKDYTPSPIQTGRNITSVALCLALTAYSTTSSANQKIEIPEICQEALDAATTLLSGGGTDHPMATQALQAAIPTTPKQIKNFIDKKNDGKPLSTTRYAEKVSGNKNVLNTYTQKIAELVQNACENLDIIANKKPNTTAITNNIYRFHIDNRYIFGAVMKRIGLLTKTSKINKDTKFKEMYTQYERENQASRRQRIIDKTKAFFKIRRR